MKAWLYLATLFYFISPTIFGDAKTQDFYILNVLRRKDFISDKILCC